MRAVQTGIYVIYTQFLKHIGMNKHMCLASKYVYHEIIIIQMYTQMRIHQKMNSCHNIQYRINAKTRQKWKKILFIFSF